MENSNKNGYGIRIQLGSYMERLWYEVPGDPVTLKKFECACRKINDIPEMEWKDFLKAVQELLKKHGFERIPK
ncbi:hypothetical protein [Niastella populi]|uniref:Uncharacterized protein n=1 Tax=Niastella populi TaxID=550983 RepID=A0A1V9GA82_9BACT|nr:hypothetical protein [Niastella populi]OQP67482.1 hypothetical protein A4R26_33415 [Niastella populi]